LSKLPVVSGQELCRILKTIGYGIDHQTGSHIILRNENAPYRRLTVPNHKEIAQRNIESYSETSRPDSRRV